MGSKKNLQASIPLVEVIAQLRRDLTEAQAQAKVENENNTSLKLFVEDIEIEFQVVVTKNLEGKGKGGSKINLDVFDWKKLGEIKLDAEASGRYEHASTQKIKLKLSAEALNATTGESGKVPVADDSEYE